MKERRKTDAKKQPSVNQTVTLSEWLQGIVVGMADKIYDRTGWSRVLGVSPQAVGNWVNGKDTPSPGNLDAILSVLETSYASLVVAQLKEFSELAARPMRETSPCARRGDVTLDDYRTEAYAERLKESLKTLSPCDQRRILSDATMACHEHSVKTHSPKLEYKIMKEAGLREAASVAEPRRLPHVVSLPYAKPQHWKSVWETPQKAVA